jgi:UDP-N-acetylglucosamine 3-dehydrogenase
MPERESLRALIVGVGTMGSSHLRVLSLMPGIEVAGIVDPHPARREAATRVQPSIGAHATLEQAVDGSRPDFACVAVPVSELTTVAGDAIGLGLPALVEKPGGPSKEAIRAIAAAAAREDVTLGVGYVERFNPAVVALKRKLEEGVIGQVHQLHARRLSPWPGRESMLGVSLDLATHDIDVMRYLTGGEVIRVFAETAQRIHDTAEDLICATLRFDGGATGVLETNWVTPTKVRQLSVTGEHGMFVVDYLTQDLYLYEHPRNRNEWNTIARMRGSGEGDMVRYALDRREPLRVELESFCNTLAVGGVPAVTMHDAEAAVAIAEAIRVSGETHEVIAPSYQLQAVG